MFSNERTRTKRASERISSEELVISNVKRLRLFIREIKEFREFREMVSRETLNSLYSLNSLNSLNSLPQCGRKHTFTRYIDTENNNQYLSERVGKCNRLDKCGYHYTPKQYFTDNPHKRDNFLVVDGSLQPCGYHYTPRQYFTDNPHKRNNFLVVDGSLRPFADNPWLREGDNVCSFVRKHRENERTNANKESVRAN